MNFENTTCACNKDALYLPSPVYDDRGQKIGDLCSRFAASKMRGGNTHSLQQQVNNFVKLHQILK